MSPTYLIIPGGWHIKGLPGTSSIIGSISLEYGIILLQHIVFLWLIPGKFFTIAITKVKMKVIDQYLKVKRSTLPGTGKGLFTTVAIPRGTVIAEYKGKVTTWKDADHRNGENLYVFYVTRNNVIDANGNRKAFAHFANDAKGPKRVKGVVNNAEYIVKNKRVFISALKDIPPNGEIFVGYGKEYWEALKQFSLK